MFIKKNFSNKVKMVSDKTEAQQTNMYFTKNDMEPVHNKARPQLDKKSKKQ